MDREALIDYIVKEIMKRLSLQNCESRAECVFSLEGVKVVSESALSKIPSGTKQVRVDKHAIITPLALDKLRECKAELIRC